MIAREIAEHARAKGVSPGQFAMAWVLNNRFVTAAIGGPRTEEQWEDYVGALSCRLDAADEAFVDGWCRRGIRPRRGITIRRIRSRGGWRGIPGGE